MELAERRAPWFLTLVFATGVIKYAFALFPLVITPTGSVSLTGYCDFSAGLVIAPHQPCSWYSGRSAVSVGRS
ncbi:hypothetical protein [Actinomyces trachealis]|uniref:hypothetical protein n=1 Tax=Actinomyces trachealis TaxID=2763540 RepID=UPI001FD3510B|nr:hypothetical protein [Actinomyces trachealis]